jgi:hypothetical protein
LRPLSPCWASYTRSSSSKSHREHLGGSYARAVGLLDKHFELCVCVLNVGSVLVISWCVISAITYSAKTCVFLPGMFWRTHHTKPDPKSMRVMPLCLWGV